jgi:transcriptional regulator with XRE-family HTH domain
MTTHFGTKVRDLRKKEGLSLEGLAKRAKVSKSYLWELENRETPNPTTDMIASIAAAFELSPAYFVDDSIDSPRQADLDSKFFRSYERLDDEKRAQLLKYLKFLESDGDR